MPIRFSLPPEPAYGAVVSAETDEGTVYFKRTVSFNSSQNWSEVASPVALPENGFWSCADVLADGPVEMVRSGRTDWPRAIDPTGCRCAECLPGAHVTLHSATDGQIRLMLAGEIACNLPADTRLVTRVTVSAGNPVMPITVVTHTETVGGES